MNPANFGQNTNSSQVLPTDFRVFDMNNGKLITTLSKSVASDLKVNDLTKILGKSWIIKSIDVTIKEIKVVEDTGTSPRPGGPV